MRADLNVATMNISLPQPLKRHVDLEVSSGGYGSASEYVREAIREKRQRDGERDGGESAAGPKESAAQPVDAQGPLPPLPVSLERWHRIAGSMKLSRRHVVVVEYVLRGMSDKQIAVAMGISHSTLRTYFDRIALRNGLRGRSAILRYALAVSQQ